MSMRFASPASDVSHGAYVVVAPCPSDLLSGTLRAAYSTADADIAQFGDLLRALDRFEPASTPH